MKPRSELWSQVRSSNSVHKTLWQVPEQKEKVMSNGNRLGLETIELLFQTLRHKGVIDADLRSLLSGKTPHLADLLEIFRIMGISADRDDFRAKLGMPPNIMPTSVDYNLMTTGLIPELVQHFHGPNLLEWKMPTVSKTGVETLNFTLKLYLASVDKPVTLDKIAADALKAGRRQATLHEMVVWGMQHVDFVKRSKMKISATGSAVYMPVGRNRDVPWTPCFHQMPVEWGKTTNLHLSYSASGNSVSKEDFLELLVVG